MPTKREREGVFSGRRRKLLRRINGSVALFPAAPRKTRSRDAEYSYQQDSNFFYLTGFEESESILVLRAKPSGPRSILYVTERDSMREQWEGERLGISRAKRRFEVDEIRDYKDFEKDVPELLKSAETLYYSPGIHDRIDSRVWGLLRTPVAPRPNFPSHFTDSRTLLAELRFVKDRQEIRAMKHAVDITAHSFMALARGLRTLSSEAHAARMLEASFARYGSSGPAFQTIVASGKNATCLHHRPSLQPLWKRELVLVDAGARFGGYSADITRCFPVSGSFSEEQAEVYDIVLRALKAATRRAKPGGTLSTIHDAAVSEITKGLVELGILEGDLKTLIKDEAYRPFYMHSTSHFLGLDTHDISPVRSRGNREPLSAKSLPLVSGCILTIEPGLYFDAKDPVIPDVYRGIGVRLEEDILITSGGCEVLSSGMPIERQDIEELLR